MNTTPTNGGRLIYVMGASGSGKDTLLRSVHAAVATEDRILVAHRYITRPSGADEASIALAPAEFERRARMGCFAMEWHSHGLRYGIGVEIDTWLQAGNTVLVNGSRAYLPQACLYYPALCAVQVVVDPRVLRLRLLQRGREAADAIEARLQRASETFSPPGGCELVRLDNNGLPEDAARILLTLARVKADAGSPSAASHY
jgi:ribose 1,5-bisphosphokinase